MHGGHNSTLEMMLAGVPMIVRPINGHQPLNAVYISGMRDVGSGTLADSASSTGTVNSRTPVGTLYAVHTEMRSVLGNALGEDGAKKLEPGHSFSRRHCSKPGFRTASRAGSPKRSETVKGPVPSS